MVTCDRCGKRTWARIGVVGDWRTFCLRCFLAAAWEPAQATKSHLAPAATIKPHHQPQQEDETT